MRVANLKLTKQLFNKTRVKIGRFVYGIPILGYCSRVAVTVAKLPLIGERLIEVERKLYPFGKERSPVDLLNFEMPGIMKNLSSAGRSGSPLPEDGTTDLPIRATHQ